MTNIIMDGATPKVMQSASESSWMPIGLLTRSKRATMPSRKSKTAPNRIKRKATGKSCNCGCESCMAANAVATQPQRRFPQVRRLGMFCLMFIAEVLFNGYRQAGNAASRQTYFSFAIMVSSPTVLCPSFTQTSASKGR